MECVVWKNQRWNGIKRRNRTNNAPPPSAPLPLDAGAWQTRQNPESIRIYPSASACLSCMVTIQPTRPRSLGLAVGFSGRRRQYGDHTLHTGEYTRWSFLLVRELRIIRAFFQRAAEYLYRELLCNIPVISCRVWTMGFENSVEWRSP